MPAPLAVSAPLAPAPPPAALALPPPQFTWTRGLLAASVLAASAYGVGSLVAPWVRRWLGMPDALADREDKVAALLEAMSKKQEALESTVTGVASTVHELEARRCSRAWLGRTVRDCAPVSRWRARLAP